MKAPRFDDMARRIRPVGLNEQEVAAALTELGEATCVELERHCGISNPCVSAALNKLKAADKAHVSHWTRVGSKSAFSRVWVPGPGEDAPRPAKVPRVRKQLPFSEPVERTPNLPTSYAFRSIFVGNKNPWAAPVTNE